MVGLQTTGAGWRQAMLSQSKKKARVQELLRERIALILLQKSKDPRLQQLTITGVDLSPDLRRARVYYLQRGQAEEDAPTRQALQKAIGFIKQELAAEHILRIMPELSFHFDRLSQQLEKVGDLFRQLAGGGPDLPEEP